MSHQRTYYGLLEGSRRMIPVEILGYSRYSFLVRLPGTGKGEPPPLPEGRFSVTADAKTFELGRCRLLPAEGHPPDEARVVFLDEQVDVSELFARGRVSISDTGLFNLRLILNQKDLVSQAFKEYSANLSFELNVYKQFFDDLDRKYAREPAAVQEYLRLMVLEREGMEFLELFDEKVKGLQACTAGLSREENEAHGFFFRNQVWDFILQSAFMARTNLKPRGYAGDYQMMKMIYENEYVGRSIFARLLHQYPVNVKAAQAVRNRRRIVADVVRSLVHERRNGDAVDVMSVACGPAAELADFFTDAASVARIRCTIVDQDEEALHTAANGARALERELGVAPVVRQISDSVRAMLRIRDLPGAWGKYDFVYSLGLFDYLTPPVARVVLERLYQTLKPGGRIIVGNFHRQNPDRVFMEYWLDWVLFYRNQREMMELAEGIPDAQRRIFFEDTGCQMFLELTAPLG